MQIWKAFFDKAKGHPVSLIIPGVWNESDPLRLAADNWKVNEEVLIYQDDGDECWVRLDQIMWGRIRQPEEE